MECTVCAVLAGQLPLTTSYPRGCASCGLSAIDQGGLDALRRLPEPLRRNAVEAIRELVQHYRDSVGSGKGTFAIFRARHVEMLATITAGEAASRSGLFERNEPEE